MWPASWWEKLYEPAIRRAAGLGRASGVPDPDTYEKSARILRHAGGRRRARPGLMAALTAARSGARVILCEEDFRFGGRLLAERFTIAGMAGADWARAAEEELRGLSNVTLLPRTAWSASMTESYAALEQVARSSARCRCRISRASACGRSWPNGRWSRPARMKG